MSPPAQTSITGRSRGSTGARKPVLYRSPFHAISGPREPQQKTIPNSGHHGIHGAGTSPAREATRYRPGGIERSRRKARLKA